MTLETLETLDDEELQECINRAGNLLSKRQEARRQEAIQKAIEILNDAGVDPAVLTARRKPGTKAPVYRAGYRYQHPHNTELIWNGRGQKPNWLRLLEREGGKAVELPPPPVKANGKAHDEK